ncbi:DUF4912 domain-containing protein [Nostoc sp. CENA67]|uniref:DUF4912 domain-containing protein n=1 Tax=Amazonocrinis nigriterrae CENA67 TaxID=2794033 RepID=A0A8J7L6L4_9NOST|nr:DUF4912 domain-containing protein [Amazonocrinis nigriterrae]MBH8561413.1 DUF4912 domain-containing protein [Amazonocrinis nigriterrae CENA67]
MWQQEKKDSAIANLALLVALATTPMAANLLVSAPLLAQSADTPSFPLPQTVDNGTTVRIDGSSDLATLNQNLKQSFEKQFAGTKVEVATNSTEAALKALVDGQVDLVGMSRGLTPEEKAQGLEQVVLRREKIALMVGAENPFKGSLTDRQFARIFRGRITDWSQLGGAAGKIRFIDRPTTSEIRKTLSNYPVFKAAQFATGANATQIAEDNTAEIIKQLGKDGISYAIASQVSKNPGLRVLQLHQTLPDDPKYPFSQPIVYVYKKNPSPAIAGFLGFTLAKPGQQAMEEARAAEANAIASGDSQALLTAANPTPSAEATSAATATPSAEATPVATATPSAEATPVATATPSTELQPTQQQPVTPAVSNPIAQGQFWWLLLPLAVITGLVTWLLRRIPSDTRQTNNTPDSTPNSPTPTDNTGVAPPVTEALTETPSNQTTSDSASKEMATDSNLSQTISPAVSNTGENITTAGAAALAGGAAVAAISTTVPNAEAVNQEIKTTDSLNTATEVNPVDPYDIGESPWDIEAPAAVVNTSYPQILDVSKNTFNVQPSTVEDTNTISDQLDVSTAASTDENRDIEVPREPTAEQPQAESNWLEDITSNASATPATANISSTTEETDNTTQVNPAEIFSSESAEVTPDLEWPTQVFSDVIPEESNIAPAASDNQDEAIAASNDPIAEQLQAELHRLDEITATESATTGAASVWSEFGETTEFGNVAELPLTEFGQPTSEIEWPTAEVTTPLPELPDLTEEAFNVVADEAELTDDETISNLKEETEDFTQADLADFAEGAAITGVGIGAWTSIYGIQDSTEPEVQAQNSSNEDIPTEDEHSSVVLTPRNPQLADVSWQISATDKQALQASGSQLALLLYDVTGLDLSYQTPLLLQQYTCEEATHDRSVTIPQNDRDYIAEIGYATDGDNWVTIARSAIVRVFSLTQIDDTVTHEPPAEDEHSSVVLTPKTSLWADVSWQISATDKQTLQASGSQLALRLYDVTGLDLSYQTPQLLQQYTCEAATHQPYVAIPQSDRDYIAEIGYVTDGDHWVTIARSAIVRVFSPPHTDDTVANELPAEDEHSSVVLTPRTPLWAEVSWQISETDKQALHGAGSPLALRLYDVTDLDLSYQTPQLLQQYTCEEATHQRFVAIPKSDRDYIIELGYVTDGDHWVKLARSAIVRVFSPPDGDFWFLADAELIIHGATQPGATVTIAGNPLTLKSDGSFHFRIPFSDNLIDYLITAVAANSEQTKTIHKKFSQETLES